MVSIEMYLYYYRCTRKWSALHFYILSQWTCAAWCLHWRHKEVSTHLLHHVFYNMLLHCFRFLKGKWTIKSPNLIFLIFAFSLFSQIITHNLTSTVWVVIQRSSGTTVAFKASKIGSAFALEYVIKIGFYIRKNLYECTFLRQRVAVKTITAIITCPVFM